MGIFTKKRPDNYSKITHWANEELKKATKDQISAPQAMFAAFMTSITPNKSAHKKRSPFFFNDYMLFEVGCYFYVLVFIWIHDNKDQYDTERDQLYDDLLVYLSHQYANIFCEFTKNNDIHKLFKNRTSLFIEMIENDKYCCDLLTQLILKAHTGQLVKEANNYSDDTLKLDLYKVTMVQAAITLIIKHTLPGFIDSLKKYVPFVRKQQLVLK